MDGFDEAAARQHFLGKLREALQDALSSFDTECAAAKRIQALFRGYYLRLRLTEMAYYATEIQRIFRGHLGRLQARRVLDAREDAASRDIAVACAVAIQRTYRGFRSRRYLHDFYARKEYMRYVADKGEELRAAAQQQLEQQLEVRGLPRRLLARGMACVAVWPALFARVTRLVRPASLHCSAPWRLRTRRRSPSSSG
jgi:hypothetical protein